MKCLTVCNPYPFLMMLPRTDPRHKRVENRPQYYSHRGDLAIHAGKGTQWLDSYELPWEERDRLVFGAVVAVVRVIACLKYDALLNYTEGPYVWVKYHEHASGPFCMIFDRVRALRYPIPERGQQGIWNWDPPAGVELVSVDGDAEGNGQSAMGNRQ